MRALERRSAIAILLLASAALPARADEVCVGPNEAMAAEAQLAKARALENGGRWAEASDAASRVDTDCVRTPAAEVKALRLRTARKAGQEAERKPDLEAAFRWYRAAESLADADRVKLAQVRKEPESEQVVAGALEWFQRRGDPGSLREVRAVAARNAERALAAEEKAFAGVGRDSLTELGRARTWLRHSGAGEARAQARAEKRGDALAAEDGRRGLELALQYYAAAGKAEQGRAVREKAGRLGEAHAKKGESEVAADYFAIAGDRARADETRKAGEERAAKAEKTRQKGFKQDQSALEKELGL